MVEYTVSGGGTVTVTWEGKAAELRRDTLPDDWETLLRDPEIAECVKDLVRQQGVAQGQRGGAGLPSIDWNDVTACALRDSGAGGSG